MTTKIPGQDGTLSQPQATKLMQFYIDSHAKSIPKDNFDRPLYESLQVLDCTLHSPGITAKSTIRLKVPPNLSNQQEGKTPRNTHGGAIPMMFDLPTSITIVACNFSNWESTGMTRRLDVTYLKPPVEGDDVILESEVLNIGKRLATIRGVLKRERDGVVLAVCQHDKYMGDRAHYVGEKWDVSKL
ncbi:hypothetical protein DOTSEDRAFT_164680 [Dothistroma septosporum NZE10]|uniref:Thioesterase domain-containing protein n=1 Tax=Dothistroma septosporum (strain NZE10 / CBS 128990) TaxID=675120 RepID=N1Q4T8_DOTSN|nr:hypothetical protein DOTSEDRAFT_164680 [Dothistroma septosporum NZE10]